MLVEVRVKTEVQEGPEERAVKEGKVTLGEREETAAVAAHPPEGTAGPVLLAEPRPARVSLVREVREAREAKAGRVVSHMAEPFSMLAGRFYSSVTIKLTK